MLSQLLQKVDNDLAAVVECLKNLQSLIKSCQGIDNSDIFDEIYQKGAGMVAPEEMSMPRKPIAKHQTMCSNVLAETCKSYLSQQPLLPIFEQCDFATKSTIFGSC